MKFAFEYLIRAIKAYSWLVAAPKKTSFETQLLDGFYVIISCLQQ